MHNSYFHWILTPVFLGIIFACLSFCTLAQSPEIKLTPREIAKTTLPSVVLVIIETDGPEAMRYGSGFFVKEDVIATNYHVVKGARRGIVKIVGKDLAYEVLGLVGVDESGDLALLKLKGVKGTPLLINQDDSIGIGDAIFAVGNPKGLEGTFSQGIVSSLRKEGGKNLIQITASISQGSSGGALVNEKGEVVGVTTGAIENGQSLNFAIPASRLRPLVENQKPLQTFAIASVKEEKKLSTNTAVATQPAPPRTPPNPTVPSKYKLPYKTPDVIESKLLGAVKSLAQAEYIPVFAFGKWTTDTPNSADFREFNEDGYIEVEEDLPTPARRSNPNVNPDPNKPDKEFKTVKTLNLDSLDPVPYCEFANRYRHLRFRMADTLYRITYKYSFGANLVEYNEFSKCSSCSDFELESTKFRKYERGETTSFGSKGELVDRTVEQHVDGTHIKTLYDSQGKMSCKLTKNENRITQITNGNGAFVEMTKAQSYKNGDADVDDVLIFSKAKKLFELSEKKITIRTPAGIEITTIDFENGKENSRTTSITDEKTGLEIQFVTGKERHKYDYEFDSVGNWTLKTDWKEVTKFGKTYFEPVLITRRLITYYPESR